MLRTLSLAAILVLPNIAVAQPAPDPDKQAAALVRQMTPEERNILLHGFFSRPNPINKLPQIGAPFAAGYTPGIARLGIPQLAESDASLGVAWINGKRARNATPLPSRGCSPPIHSGGLGVEWRGDWKRWSTVMQYFSASIINLLNKVKCSGVFWMSMVLR